MLTRKRTIPLMFTLLKYTQMNAIWAGENAAMLEKNVAQTCTSKYNAPPEDMMGFRDFVSYSSM